MSSTTLNADGFDWVKRNIILNTNSKSLVATNTDDDDTAVSKKSSSSKNPPRAYIRLVGMCCIYLEPQDAKPIFRPEVFGFDAAFNGGRLPLKNVLKVLIGAYDRLMAQDDEFEIFADTAEEPATFSKLSQMKAADLFLKSSDNYEQRDAADEIQVIIMDPHGDRWQFEELEQDKAGNAIRELRTKPPKIVKETLSPEFFYPSLRYTRPVFPSFDAKGVAERIKQAKNVIVAVGAGLSVAAGISDFRSKNGLYSKLEKYQLPKPESLFTLDYFKQNPDLFYRVSNEMNLWPGTFAPTLGHHFIRLLEKHGKLRQVFTQNIDCLERAAGVSPDILVEAHGSYATAHCTNTKGERHPMSTSDLRDMVDKQGKPPMCPTCGAPVKPDVVFFGEGLPKLFFERMAELKSCDLLLVVGTSLAVFPFALVAGHPPKRHGTDEPLYPRVLLNMERVGEFTVAGDPRADNAHPENIFDCFLGGDCQEAVRQIADHLGWGQELEAAYSEGKKKVVESQ